MRKAIVMRVMRGIMLGALVIGLFLAMQGIANAGLIGVRLTSGASVVTCLDGQACDTTAPGDGSVSFSGTVGIFVINISTGISYPLLGTPEKPWIDMNSVNITTSGPGELEVLVSQTDYTGVITASTFSGGGTQTNMESIHEIWLHNGNVQFGLGTMIDQHAAHGPSFNWSSSPPDPGEDSQYSLTLRALIQAGQGTASTSFDHEYKVAPEPASALLFGPALALIGLMRNRRRAPIAA